MSRRQDWNWIKHSKKILKFYETEVTILFRVGN